MRTLAAALLATSIGAAAMADPPKTDPPKANVSFVIEAQEFVTALGDSRKGVERALTQVILEECRKPTNFPFIRWVSGDPSAPNALVAALVEKRVGGGVATQIEYRATTAEGTRKLPELEETVYRWFDPKNADIPDVVRPSLENKVKKKFENATFRGDLLRTFVSRIPLTDRVEIRSVTHRVVVKVPPSTLLADETKSELSVNFFGKIVAEPGVMRLRQPVAFSQEGGVICLIEDFNFGGVPPLTDNWNDRIPQVFGPAKVRDVRVTMTNFVYKWYPDTTGGSLRHD